MAGPTQPVAEGPELSGVEDLLGAFLAPDGLAVTEAECAEGVLALERIRNLTDAALCAGVGRFDATQVYVADAMRSTVAWLRSRTELSHGQASQVIHRARVLRLMPVVEAAYGQGLIGTAKVDALAHARSGVEELFAEQEDVLVAKVRTLNAEQTRMYLRRWRAVALATIGASDDGPEPDREDVNRFQCTESLGGRHKIDGDLDAESGRIVVEAINAGIDAMFRSGEVHASDGIERRRLGADAFMAIIARGALAGTRAGRPRPSVTLNVDLAALLGIPIDGPDDVWARTCELAGGLAITRAAAERLMCEADVTAILTDTGLDGIVTPLGAVHQNRYPTANERRALAIRDLGCVYPGCGAPVEWTQAHHIDHWHLYERTELDRLVLLCRFHHRAVHDGGHRLERSPGGVVTVTRPDGTRLGPVTPGQLVTEPELVTGPGPTAEQGSSPPRTSAGHPARPPNQFRPPTRFRPLSERRTPVERRAERERRRLGMVMRTELRILRGRGHTSPSAS